MAEAPCALEVDGAVLRFGGITALDGVGFEVEEGETYGVIGPNGAGKTALLNCVSGVYRLDSGRVALFGRRIDGTAPHRIAGLGLSRTFQNTEHFTRFTVRDYVMLGRLRRARASVLRSVFARPAAERAERHERRLAHEALDRFGLADTAGEEIADLPYGMQKRIDIARAVQGEPRVLLLDEPTSGTTTSERKDVSAALRAVSEQGIATVVVDHDVDFVSRHCGRVIVVSHGQPLGIGSPADMLRRPDVVEAFLGVPAAHTG